MTKLIMTAVLLVWTGKPVGTAWNTNYADALKAAKENDKPIFIVFDAGSSELSLGIRCGFFGDEKVEQSLDDDYVRMYVDVETDAGHTLADQFGATEFPRIVVLDRTGDWQVYRRSGNHNPDELRGVVYQFRRSKYTGSSFDGPRALNQVLSQGTTRTTSAPTSTGAPLPTAASQCKS